MSFWQHLEELRTRFIRSLWVFMLGFVICYYFSDRLLGVLKKPIFDALPPDQRKLYFTSLFENFMTHLKIAGYGSILLFSPYFFFELWGFVKPGLHDRERKLVVPFVSSATVFFLGGASFAYFVLFPVGFKYFINYGTSSDVPMLTIDSYYTTCLKLLLLFGLAFELPVLVCLFGILGLVDAPTLKQHRKTAIMGISVIAALFAPPDAVSMLILGAPLILLYEASIWVVVWIGKKKAQDAKNRPGQPPPPPDQADSHPWEGRSR